MQKINSEISKSDLNWLFFKCIVQEEYHIMNKFATKKRLIDNNNLRNMSTNKKKYKERKKQVQPVKTAVLLLFGEKKILCLQLLTYPSNLNLYDCFLLLFFK